MSTKRLLTALSILVFLALPLTVYAQGDVTLSQAYVQKQYMDVFMVGSVDIDNLSCRVSNRVVEITDVGLLADKGITIRTTVLVDVSTSMPSRARGNVISFINAIIEGLSANEQLRIVTFGEQLTVLQEFTSDRFDLSLAAGKIEINEKESQIYDAIFNTIPPLQPIDDEPCYYRTIVITDGVDDTTRGITREELYLKLQTDTYPLEVVEVTSASTPEPHRELGALTRISNGKYINLHASSNVSDLVDEISVGDVLWLRAVLPWSLLDGSMRQVDISDGISSMQFDIKVNVFDISEIEAPTPTAAPPYNTTNETVDPGTIQATPAAGSQSLSDGDQFFQKYGIFIYIGIGVILLLAAGFACVIIWKKRKPAHSGGVLIEEGTVYIGDDDHNEGCGNQCIRLQNANDANQVWDIAIKKEVLVGRETSCKVHLADSSVARRQCRIYTGADTMIENLSKTNITQLNGKTLVAPSKIKVGDKIKCGRITLVVESLYYSESGDLNKGTVFINV